MPPVHVGPTDRAGEGTKATEEGFMLLYRKSDPRRPPVWCGVWMVFRRSADIDIDQMLG